ncbi:MAG TPA: hypothetical protein VLT33_34295 [Labilithrix sp.]|nr:hypothetical protein [Labilithrix sp.]
MAEQESTFEMLWDCKFCGQKKLLGLTHRYCAGCGAPQDPAARYFPVDHEKVAVKDSPFVGADVACPACRQPMSRAAKCCTSCGSPIDKGAQVALRGDVVVPDAGAAPLGGADAFAAGRYGPDAQPAPGQAPASKKAFPTALVIAGGALMVIVVVVLVMFLWKRESALEVTGHTWERSVAVERLDLVKKTAWCDEAPSGGRELSRGKEQRGSRQVKDGETCQTRKKDNGNGTFKEIRECQPKFKSEPILSDRCTFEVSEWRTYRTAAEKGASLAEKPRWPAVALARPGSCVGCEREGARSEKYTVSLRDSKTKTIDTCDLPEARWSTFAKGSKWKGQVRVITGGLSCDGLTRQ